MGAQMWSLLDDQGAAWRGILFVAALEEDARELSFSISRRQE